MTIQTASQAASNAPQTSTAMARIATAAYQRAYALSLSTLEQLLLQGAQQSDQSTPRATDGAVASASSALSPPALEPVLRYAAGMLGIYQAATEATADLLAAQLHGEQQKVDALADRAKSQVDEAVRDAAAATGSVFSTGFEVASRLTGAAALAAQRIRAQDQAGDDASPSRPANAHRARQSHGGAASGRH